MFINKKTIIIIFHFISFFAYAQKSTTSDQGAYLDQDYFEINEFGKPSYFPSKGKSFFSAGTTTFLSQKTLTGNHTQISKIRNISTDFNYVLGYGLTKAFKLELDGQYNLSNHQENNYIQNSNRNNLQEFLKKSGWVEPSLGLTWRALNENNKFKIDLSLKYQPQLRTAQYATPTAEGNAALGRQTISTSLKLYKEIDLYEFFFSAERNFLSSQKAENVTDARETTEETAYQINQFRLGIYSFYSEKIILGGGLSFINADPFKYSQISSKLIVSTTDYDSASSSSLLLDLILKLEPRSHLKFSIERILNSSVTGTEETFRFRQNISGTNLGWNWVYYY